MANMHPASPPRTRNDKRWSLLRRLSALKRAVLALWGERYDPAKHYMRGPGPKTVKRLDNSANRSK